MRRLYVYIEINGREIYVGDITGDTSSDACFAYDGEYIAEGYPSISVSLPLSKRSFSADATRNFFEGILPEGFVRRSVADWLRTQEDDYLTILSDLGCECLGAFRISDKPCASAHGSYKALSVDEVRALAREGVSKSTELVTAAHLSLTGASGKVGLYYDETGDTWYLPKGDAPSTHIVKQSHIRLSGIVTNEQLSLLTAARLGIEIPESFIINVGSTQDSDVLFATKRYDRVIPPNHDNVGGLARPRRLHQEDLAQALGISSHDKYETADRSYLPEIFRIIRSYSADPIKDQLRLWDILIYDFLIGNTDNHIKNLSLLYSDDLRAVRLAPAYDIISTVIYPGSSREMAVGIGGQRDIDRITRDSFLQSAQNAGLSKKIAMQRFDRMADRFEEALEEVARELTGEGYTQAGEIKERILKNGGMGYNLKS